MQISVRDVQGIDRRGILLIEKNGRGILKIVYNKMKVNYFDEVRDFYFGIKRYRVRSQEQVDSIFQFGSCGDFQGYEDSEEGWC